MNDELFEIFSWELSVYLGYTPEVFHQYRHICMNFATFSYKGQRNIDFTQIFALLIISRVRRSQACALFNFVDSSDRVLSVFFSMLLLKCFNVSQFRSRSALS